MVTVQRINNLITKNRDQEIKIMKLILNGQCYCLFLFSSTLQTLYCRFILNEILAYTKRCFTPLRHQAKLLFSAPYA